MLDQVTEALVLSSATSLDSTRLDAQKLRVRNLEHKNIRLAVSPDLLVECDREGLVMAASSRAPCTSNV